jgi:hypothetical protein
LDSGSSISTSRGSSTIARAIATRCCCPPESWAGNFGAWSVSCTSRNASSTRRSRSAFATLRIDSPNATLRRTDMCGNNA